MYGFLPGDVYAQGGSSMTADFVGSPAHRVRLSAAILFTWLVFTPAAARADVVLDWNEIAARTIAVGQSPFNQARLTAIVQLAVFEAVNAVTGEYEPYLDVPIVAPSVASADAAAIAAAYKVLKTYFPANTDIDANRTTWLAAIPDGLAKTNGILVGEAAADAMTLLRASDGASPNTFFVPSSTRLSGGGRPVLSVAGSHALRHQESIGFSPSRSA
jgi:hypothetical protein